MGYTPPGAVLLHSLAVYYFVPRVTLSTLSFVLPLAFGQGINVVLEILEVLLLLRNLLPKVSEPTK